MKFILAKNAYRSLLFKLCGPANALPPSARLLTVGKHTYGFEHLVLHAWNDETTIQIGSYCSIADSVHVYLGGNHPTDWISTYPFGVGGSQGPIRGIRTGHPTTKGHIKLGNDVWVGSHSSIMSGVVIQSGSVIAAHSHVVSDVPAYAIVGGNPAKVIRYRFPKFVIDELLDIAWWDWPETIIRKNSDLLCRAPDKETLAVLREISQIHGVS